MIGDITSGGNRFNHAARPGSRGGGVGSLFQKCLSIRIAPVKTKSIECLDACVGSIRLKQHNTMHTNTNGNILDLVISRGNDNFVVRVVRVNGMIAEHGIVDIKLAISKLGWP